MNESQNSDTYSLIAGVLIVVAALEHHAAKKRDSYTRVRRNKFPEVSHEQSVTPRGTLQTMDDGKTKQNKIEGYQTTGQDGSITSFSVESLSP